MKDRHPLASIVLAAASVLAAPAALAADTWRVDARIDQGGERVGEPSVIVRSGVPADMAVHGDNGYGMSVTVVPNATGLLDVTVRASTSVASVSTAMTTAAGKPITVASGEMGLTMTITEAE